MATQMSREQAAAAVAEAAAERDSIQANLLDLDGSFGKRMLAGATLTGESKLRWETAAADLATLWEMFNAYAAVVDKAAELMAAARRPSDRELAQVTTWLTGASVELSRQKPLGRRGLTETGKSDLTLAAAVQEMKRAFASVADVVAAAESVWNETADGLSEIGTQLAEAKEQLGDLSDDEVTGALAAAEDELGQLRDVLNSDPLALWQGGRAARGSAPLLRPGAGADHHPADRDVGGGHAQRAARAAGPHRDRPLAADPGRGGAGDEARLRPRGRRGGRGRERVERDRGRAQRDRRRAGRGEESAGRHRR